MEKYSVCCTIKNNSLSVSAQVSDSVYMNVRGNGAHDGQVGVVGGFAQPQFLLLVWSHPLQHAVEDVVVPLVVGLQTEGASDETLNVHVLCARV